jgi:hypothetical protein
VVHTHEVTVDGAVLTKRYTSWRRGEHRREWTVLRHVHRYAPDLVPRPVAADLDARPPTVTMSVVPGTPLCGALTAEQTDALATAITAPVTVLGHRDPNLGNYLWDGTRVRIVDFEDAAVSDPATELAILAEHLSLREVDADAFCARFAVDRRRLRAARRLWAMFWLRLLLPGGPAARRNPAGTADRQAGRLLRLLHPRRLEGDLHG